MKKLITSLVLFSSLLCCICMSACSEEVSHKYDIVDHPYYKGKLETYAEENKALPPEGADCVFIGDSWTDLYNLGSYYTEFSVLNRGIGGDTSYGLLQRLDVSVYQAKPKVVVMLIGGNNLKDCKEDIEQIVVSIRTNLPQTKIIMQSMYGVCNTDWLPKASIMEELNVYFQELCDKYGLTYVDHYSRLVDENGVGKAEYHVSDGVHISELGYALITENLKPVILKLLEERC